ncbi:MAG TPA: hypothetical protein VNR41_10320 [Xanthobacteraceae bacterium]|jgi:hypothetical protein|nr:hypothetical protein [Xanthobacteraceae bacterium]
MPAFGKRLTAELEIEFARLANDWFSPWHALMRGEAVELDDFRGGILQLPSKAFDAATEQAFWAAVRRYSDGKIADTFHRIEQHIRWQGTERALRTVEEGTIALRSFLERIHRHAVFTEYRLQARGYPDERYFASRRDNVTLASIQRRKMDLIEKYRSTPWRWRIAEAITDTADQRLVGAAVLVLMMGSGFVLMLR